MRIIPTLAAALFAFGPMAAHGQVKVGEMHRLIADPSAAVRDAHHDPHARMTVWYPATAESIERPVQLGAPGTPVFEGGRAAVDAAWREGRWPVILVSHGFGGAAVQMAWLATELARRGYVVVSVDHPGNNGIDQMTREGATLWWLRAEDLRVALLAVEADPVMGPHLDPNRLGAAGFSLGGFTSLVLAGAQPDPRRYLKHCQDHGDDGVCLPQKELPSLDPRERARQEAPTMPPPTRALPLKAVFVLAPAVISGLDPDSLRGLRMPVEIVLGDADSIATPRYNGLALATLLPRAKVKVLPGVNHYDFLDQCTPAGQANVRDYCRRPGDETQARAHAAAIGSAVEFFNSKLR